MRPEQPEDILHLPNFTVGDWLVEPRTCQISRGQTIAKLRPQVTALLVCLARRSGELVLKDEILAEVWPGQFIAESGLSRCMAELRQFLQDDAQEPRYIQTVPKRGYRLMAPVAWSPPSRRPLAESAGSSSDESRTPNEGSIHRSRPDVENGPAVRQPFRSRRLAWGATGVLLLAAAAVGMALLAPGTGEVLLSERDRVVLAYENKTGDVVFDDTIPMAVSIELEQSPYLALLSDGRVREVLRMMKRPPETPISREVGLEICERVGVRALILTSIVRLGQQYVVGLEALTCGSGRVLARDQATADRKEEVLRALARAAGGIRRVLGEPRPSLDRYRVPALEATTPSLEALRAVRQGDVARGQGRTETALDLYREAVTLDRDFALAYNRIGLVTYGQERQSALRKAYALRQQVTLPERLEIEAAYSRHVTGEIGKVLEALERLRRTYPRHALARRGLALEYMSLGRYGEALDEARAALRLEPGSALTLAVVARAHLYLNQITEARRSAEEAIAVGSATADPHVILFWCGVAEGDEALLARERSWAAEHPDSAPEWLEDQAEEAMNRGRLGEAIGFMERFEAWATAHAVAAWPARIRLRIARYEALCGRVEQAMERLEAELGRAPEPLVKMDAVGVAVSAGQFEVAARLLDEMEHAGEPGVSHPGAALARAYRAAIAANQGQTALALDLLESLRPLELGYAYGFVPVFERARALDRAGDFSGARAAFEAMLAHPMVDSARKLQPHAELGLARTLARAGDVDGSRQTYQRFLQRWRHADPDLPVLRQARREYAALEQSPDPLRSWNPLSERGGPSRLIGTATADIRAPRSRQHASARIRAGGPD